MKRFTQTRATRARRAGVRTGALLVLPAALSFALVVTSCSRDAAPPTAPAASVAPTGANGDLLGGLVGGVGSVVGGLTGTLLSCPSYVTYTATKTIGPLGGTITVGPHKLVVPPGALTQNVTITATAPAGRYVAVEFKPQGLTFLAPSALTLSYKQCGLLSVPPLKIVYIDDEQRILEVLVSLQNLLLREVTGKVNHFSQYALAY